MSLVVVEPGRLAFPSALDLQLKIAETVRDNPKLPHLILLEHAPVFTLGRSADESNVLDAHEIPVIRTDRGGDVTYHGPGQLVGYPIFPLQSMGWGIRKFVGQVERILIAALGEFGVDAEQKTDCPGVWHGGAKIASLGFRVDRGVTRHGFALNVNNSLEPFSWINPCGVSQCPVTSLEAVLGRDVAISEVSAVVRAGFDRRFR